MTDTALTERQRVILETIRAAIAVSSKALPSMRNTPPQRRRRAGSSTVAMQPITFGASSTAIVK